MRLIFHVGLHKTGTTTLQRRVFPNLRGIFYIGRDGQAVHGTTLIEPGLDTLLYSDETILGRLVDLYSTVRARRDSWVETQISGLERLKARFPDCEIVLSIRRHESWLPSIYSHYLRYGGAAHFGDFFRWTGDGILAPDDLELAPRLESAIQLFGGRIFVLWQEELLKDPARVLGAIARFLGLEGWNGPTPQRENESLSTRGASVLRFLNSIPGLGATDHVDRADRWSKGLRRWRISPYHLSRRLDRWIASERRMSLPVDISRVVQRHFESDIQRVERLLPLAMQGGR